VLFPVQFAIEECV